MSLRPRNNERRSFLKWLAAAGAAATTTACSSRTLASDAPNSLDAEAGAATCRVTSSDVLGPFHRKGAPKRQLISPHTEPGERLKITGRVLTPDCKPLQGALLDIWHADVRGQYDNHSKSYRLRGQVMTDAQGRYSFETIMPGRYKLGDSWRPAHVHFNVSAPGCRPLTTQLYFEGDPYLAKNDPCEVCNSGDPSQIIALTRSRVRGKKVHSGAFDIVLAKA